MPLCLQNIFNNANRPAGEIYINQHTFLIQHATTMSIDPKQQQPASLARTSLAHTTPVPPYDEGIAVSEPRRTTRQGSLAVPARDNATGLAHHPGMFAAFRGVLLVCIAWVTGSVAAEITTAFLLDHYFVDTTWLIIWTVVDAVVVVAIFPLEMKRQHVHFRLFYEARRPVVSGNKVKDLKSRLKRFDRLVVTGRAVVLSVFFLKVYVVLGTQELELIQLVPVLMVYIFTVLVNLLFLGRLAYLIRYVVNQRSTDSKAPQPRCRVLALPIGAYVQPVKNNGGHLLQTFPDNSARLITYGLLTADQLDNFLKDQTDDKVIATIALAGMEAQLSALE